MNVETVWEGKFIRIQRRGKWEFADRTKGKEAVEVVAVTSDGKLILIEQYRAPVDKRVVELPAGLVGDDSSDESGETAASRELEEETGYKARSIRFLTKGPSSAGTLTEIVSFYAAEGIEKTSEGGGVSGEDIDVHEVPLAEVRQWIAEREKAGRMIDPRIWTGLYFLEG